MTEHRYRADVFEGNVWVIDGKNEAPLGWLEGDTPEVQAAGEKVAGMFGVRNAQVEANRYGKAQVTMERILSTPRFQLLKLAAHHV